MNNHELTIRYLTGLNQISLQTLIQSLSQISVIIQEINQELSSFYHLEKDLDVRVEAFQPGSFMVKLNLDSVEKETLTKLMIRESHSVTAEIGAVFLEVLALKQFLKGAVPEKVEKSRGSRLNVWRSKDEKMQVDKKTYQIYMNNEALNEALDRNFETLYSDPEVEGFELKDGAAGKTRLFEKNLFEEMARPNAALLREAQTAVIPGARLSVFRIVFHDKYKWQFYYKGIRISAPIHDQQFFRQIDAGKKFSKGDTLICELQINKVFDPTVNTYINKSYQINKVYQHIPRPEQGELDFEN